MKYLASLTLMFSLCVAAAYAQDGSVKMTFSGTSAPSTIILPQPDTTSDSDNFVGGGTLGTFTLTDVRAIANSPGTSSTCSGANQLFFSELAGAGVFRFQDGSLLEVALTQGGDCIDLTTNVAHCTVTFHITRGTGRFQHASGVLTMNENVTAVAIDTNGDPVADAYGNPIFFAATGGFTGTISGVATAEQPNDAQQ
ncbi:MAG TPA: hypothetical protein VG028_00555 [Terriglobia bacterium]|nr:hypothetical protein [Terriglobia bacterium]